MGNSSPFVGWSYANLDLPRCASGGKLSLINHQQKKRTHTRLVLKKHLPISQELVQHKPKKKVTPTWQQPPLTIHFHKTS